MYVVFSINKIRPEHLDEFLAGVKHHAAKSATEPGCIRFEVLQCIDDPLTVCLEEVFLDAAAFRAHQRTDHYESWMETSRDWRFNEQRIRHVLDFAFPEMASSR